MIIFLEGKMLQASIIHLRETSEVLSFLNYCQHYSNTKRRVRVSLQNKINVLKWHLKVITLQVISRVNLLHLNYNSNVNLHI